MESTPVEPRRLPNLRSPLPCGWMIHWRNIIPILAIGLLAIGLDRYALQSFQESNHRQALQTLSRFRAELEQSLNSRLLLAHGLAAFAKDRPNMAYAEFLAFVKNLLEQQEGIRSIQWAPNAIVTYVYPIEGNEAAIGYDLRADPAIRESVQEAIQDRKFMISGPANLRQGGFAVIARLPVYANSDVTGKDQRFIGFSTIIVDMDYLYRVSRLDEFEKTLRIAIRGRGGLGDQGAVFYGGERLFSQSTAETSEITLPYGHWRIAAEMRSPQTDSWPGRWPLVVAILLFMTLFMLLNRRTWLSGVTLIEQETRYRAAIESTQDGFWTVNREGRLLEVNQSYIQRSGYSRNELLAMQVSDLEGAESSEETAAHTERCGRSKLLFPIGRTRGVSFLPFFGISLSVSGCRRLSTRFRSACIWPPKPPALASGNTS